MTANPNARLRADAQRNRDQIIAAAREMFAAQGSDVPMEEIARTAGVGVGTLYRRFADRESLIRAVAQESFKQVLEEARAALAEEPTGWDALARLIGRPHQIQLFFQLALVSSRAREILRNDPKARELRDALIAEIAQAVKAAQAEGTMRPDVGAGDIAILFSLMTRQLPPGMRTPETLGFDRIVAIVLSGLRAGSEGVLPGHPISAEDVRRFVVSDR